MRGVAGMPTDVADDELSRNVPTGLAGDPAKPAAVANELPYNAPSERVPGHASGASAEAAGALASGASEIEIPGSDDCIVVRTASYPSPGTVISETDDAEREPVPQRQNPDPQGVVDASTSGPRSPPTTQPPKKRARVQTP